MEKHNNPFIFTSSGSKFHILNPTVDEIILEDIAHALSMICRYGGHLPNHYSVAQHSVLGSYIVPKQYAMAMLFHDGSEAYIGDVVTPLKRLMFDVYKPIEDKIQNIIAEAFGFEVSEECEKEIKKADNILLATEVRDLVPAKKVFSQLSYEPLIVPILDLWNKDLAKQRFIDRYLELENDKKKGFLYNELN